MELLGQTYSQSHYKEFAKTKRKNIFEEVIDKLMIDTYLPEEFKSSIQYLPVGDKRRAIFLYIDKKSHFVLKKVDELDENAPLEEVYKVVLEAVRKYLEVGEQLAKDYGEVYTPLWLVNKMLDKLPKNVWINPNLKWLDPANGIGNFPLMVIIRLMKKLKKWEPDVEKRYKHIIENMIYVCELQPRNSFTYLYLVDTFDRNDVNLYCGSYIDDGFEYHKREVWEVDRFDIILGNPPYNKAQTADGKRGGGSTLWDKFIMDSINKHLKENGYLLFVNPALWRKPQSDRSSSRKVSKLMSTKQIHYLEIHDAIDGKKTFNAGTRYDFYLLQNSPSTKLTEVIDQKGNSHNIDLNEFPFIPNFNFEFVKKLFAKGNDKKCPIIFDVTNYETRQSWVSDAKDDVFKYELVYSTPQKGTRWKYSSRNDNGHFGIPKVIFGDSGIYDVIIDMEGRYGMAQHSMAIKVSDLEEAESIKSVLLSDKFKEFVECVMWSNFQLDWRMFTYFKKDFWKEFI